MDNSNCNTSSSTSGRVGNPSDGGSGTETVDESQDEPSSSKDIHHELDNFRLQWRREIELSPNKEKASTSSELNLDKKNEEPIEEKAKTLFLKGVQAEKNGKLQDAISLYRRAIQLVPDIEFRIEENIEDNFNENIEDSESDKSDSEENSSSDDDDTDNLVNKFKKLAFKAGTSRICEPKHEQKTSHMSCLPPEIFLYILKWVVGENLDIYSLEKTAKVCRGFYLCSRDPELWHLICLRTWDMNIDNPNKYGSWRNMYIQRPHLSFNGVYISKTTYVRYGESSFQDTHYKPCFLVAYYRYLRFFPDGTVLMLTTPDDPYQSIYKLRHKTVKDPNVHIGRFKLVGSTVVAAVKKSKSETVAQSTNFYNRYRRHRQANLSEVQDQTYHLELEVKNYKKRINCQLAWMRYSSHVVYRIGEEAVSEFDILPSTFPPFWFSRVKSYTAESESPLERINTKLM
ncbi:F-box only protein 9-like [Argiope bruennichi]|uniref:F-box only protein 9 n=1 Tax=Argiope bruennichi TaxID=94029 RepID=A0A8T0E8D5_ARGBR|nr:F-box only protein 9-like [Argiope bruennichi]KAF8767600.1 F-box only protein 9 like protein [Argiope bruennichi]